MSTGKFFIVSALFYSFLLIVIYFSKQRYKSIENKIYSLLIFTSFVGVLLEIGCRITIPIMDSFPVINFLVCKFYLIYLLTWVSLLTIYTIIVSLKIETRNSLWKKIFLLMVILFIFNVIAILLFPIRYYNDGNLIYTFGMSVYWVYVVSFIYVIFSLIVIVFKSNNKKDKKFIPIFLFIFIGTTTTVIQLIYPGLLLATSMETFITVLMYFTIENPDMKLLDEAHEAKENADKSNYEKSMFLYDMTQEIRSTTDTINDYADVILETDNIEEKDDGARNIKATTAKFSATTSDILDINNINDKNIKVYNSKYSIKLLIKEMVASHKDKIINKGIDFRTRIDSTLPENLYGDTIGLKRVMGIILDNACKYTNSGFIELDIDSIVKYNICRLVITIEDSGVGIKASEIDKIFNKRKEEYGVDSTLADNLHNANNLINAMGGTIVVMSDYEKGSKFKIIIDQKIDEEKTDTVSKYEEIYEKINILLVDDSEAGIKIAKKIFSKMENISVDMISSSKECLDKIRNRERYDYIFIDEEMEPINGHELMAKLKEIKSFKIPVILLSQNNNIEYDDDYKKEGFSNYLLKPLDKEKILKIIKESK